MAQTKRKRTRTRATASATPKRRRQASKTSDANRGAKQQRAAQGRASSRTTSRGGKRIEDDESTRRRGISEYDPVESVESVSRREPRGGRLDEGVEDIDERSRRPGGTGDASFGDTDEGQEGPVR